MTKNRFGKMVSIIRKKIRSAVYHKDFDELEWLQQARREFFRAYKRSRA